MLWLNAEKPYKANQSVLQFKGSGGSIPRLKLDEPSQTVAQTVAI